MSNDIKSSPNSKKNQSSRNRKNKKRRLEYRFSAVIFIAVIFFVSSFFWFMIEASSQGIEHYENSSKSKPASVAADSSKSESETSESIGDTLQSKSEPDESEWIKPDINNPVVEKSKVNIDYFENCAFVGNELAEVLTNNIGISKNVVYSDKNLTPSVLETKILSTVYGQCNTLHALTQQKPDIIYVILGSETIDFLDLDKEFDYISDFIELLNASLSKSSICITAIPSVNDSAGELEENPIKNSEIDEFNQRLLELCNKEKVHFIDLAAALKDDEGLLSSEYVGAEGFGLNSAAYSSMSSYLLTHTIN